MNMIYVLSVGSFIHEIWDFIKDALKQVILLLPTSPFTAISNSEVANYLGGLNWIFPISEMIAILELWLVSISGFYIYMAIARWVKAIE